jgi:hypothetical protein
MVQTSPGLQMPSPHTDVVVQAPLVQALPAGQACPQAPQLAVVLSGASQPSL